MKPRAAIFLDRDGTIIEDAHYLADPQQVRLLPKAAEALARLKASGYLLFLHTNQSGVGRGYFTIDAVHRCNERMLDLLGMPRPVFEEVCIAPETPDEPSVYRKPSPRFISECVERYGLDRAHTWMVGDKPSDVAAGTNAGVRSAFIASTEPTPPGADARFASLYDFAAAMPPLT